jgi:predicted ATPase
MLRRIGLQNFKAFQNQQIELRPLTLLAGLNGMGKSTVLQSMLLLRQSHERGMLQNDELDLNGELVSLGTGKDILLEGAPENVIGIDIEADEGSGKWRFPYSETDDVLSKAEAEFTDRSGTIYDSNLFTDHFHYLQAERLGPRVFLQTSEYMVRQHKQIGTQGEYAAQFLASFETKAVLQEMQHPNSVAHTLKAQVETWMNEISPGINLNVSDFTNLGVVQLGVGFERANDIATRHFKATNVGFGISYTLPILVALLSAEEGTLILLENPEAHLHPRGQSQLGNLLARAADAGVQVIVETHSDHILNGMRIAIRKYIAEPEDIALHYFYRDIENPEVEGAQVKSPEIDKYGKLSFWPEGFFDEYGKNLDELL